MGWEAGSEATVQVPGDSLEIESPHNQQLIAEMPPATILDARPAALVNGRAISWGELRPTMTEAAGGVALEELVLEQQLRRVLADTGRIITDSDLAAEQDRLVKSINDDAEVAARLLRDLRARRNLGSRRFEMLLWRNAALRKLVADRVTVTEQQLTNMHTIVYGEKRQARLITAPTLASAQDVLDRLRNGEQFATVATEVSTDVSAARGGLLAPISVADPEYPQLLRDTLTSMGFNEQSSPLLIDGQYAIVQLVDVIPASDVPLADVRARLTELVREQQEAALMDRAARQLLRDAAVRIFDPALLESWGNRERAR